MTTNPPEQTPEQGPAVPPAPEAAAPPPPAPGYAAPAPAGPQPPLSDSDQRMWAMLAHLGGIILGFVAPLVVWLIYKERGYFVERQAKESLNFQITAAIAWVVIFILTLITLGIASILYILLWVAILIFCIIAGMAANKGEDYRYPVAIRLIK
jgi:uncharacterized Tic20 family protein